MARAERVALKRQMPSRRWIITSALRSGLFSPVALLTLGRSVARSGVNLIALVRMGARICPAGVIDDGAERVGYTALADQAERIAATLNSDLGVGHGTPVAIAAANGLGFVRALLALSRLGARAVLINPGLPASQVAELLNRHGVDRVIATHEAIVPISGIRIIDPTELLSLGTTLQIDLPRRSSGEIVVLTGGTTGLPKAAARAVAPGRMLRLFLHLVAALRMKQQKAVLVTVPLFHGFGLASLIIALALGRTVHLRPRLDAEAAAALIEAERIDTLVAVPTVLRRLLAVPAPLCSLNCVISGGSPLDVELVQECRRHLGESLFNLYGTSEAGLAALALPEDLAMAPDTIGRPVWGADIRLGAEGELLVRNAASISARDWIPTGDLAYRDPSGRLFLRGRTDDMIVSGGENANPWELESVLITHPQVAQAVAIGIPDRDFGERLAVYVVPRGGVELEGATLLDWVKGRVARHLMPRSVTICSELPLTAIGKIDRNALRQAAI
ncbi:hypothetical protein DMC47_07635 [Nostoc sp. 3335mG]|nr:hypothetical protein DMC47_07635 [Nostoc sp. 3335mG]